MSDIYDFIVNRNAPVPKSRYPGKAKTLKVDKVTKERFTVYGNTYFKKMFDDRVPISIIADRYIQEYSLWSLDELSKDIFKYFFQRLEYFDFELHPRIDEISEIVTMVYDFCIDQEANGEPWGDRVIFCLLYTPRYYHFLGIRKDYFSREMAFKILDSVFDWARVDHRAYDSLNAIRQEDISDFFMDYKNRRHQVGSFFQYARAENMDKLIFHLVYKATQKKSDFNIDLYTILWLLDNNLPIPVKTSPRIDYDDGSDDWVYFLFRDNHTKVSKNTHTKFFDFVCDKTMVDPWHDYPIIHEMLMFMDDAFRYIKNRNALRYIYLAIERGYPDKIFKRCVKLVLKGVGNDKARVLYKIISKCLIEDETVTDFSSLREPYSSALTNLDCSELFTRLEKKSAPPKSSGRAGVSAKFDNQMLENMRTSNV